jgi:Uma2 family endonuclease
METMSTTPTTADPTVPTESPMPPISPSVPTLDELERLAPGESTVFRGVDWNFYERVSEIVGERPRIRIAYDGRDLEIMPASPLHEDDAWFGASVIQVVAEELRIPWKPMESTTWKRAAIKRGIEADKSFYLDAEKVAAATAARARRSANLADHPNPDLAIEVDISQPKIDRPGIYAALKVAEVWRFRESAVTIERLTNLGTYEVVEASGFLAIRADEVARWVFREDSADLTDWNRRLRAWVQAELVPRRAQ